MRAALTMGSGVLLAFILLPLVAIVLASVSTDMAFPPLGFTLHWFGAALDVASFRTGLRVSLLVAVLATAVATPLGVAAAVGLVRWRSRWRGVVDMVLLSPLLVPGLVIGIGLLIATSLVDLEFGVWRLVAGHVLIVLPFIVRTTYASLAGQDDALEEAARTMGAGEARILWRVTLPLAVPGIAAGMLFAFILSFDDVPVSLFLADARSATLPLAVLSYLEFNFDPAVSAVSAAQILATLVLAVVLERLFGLGRLYRA